AVPGGGQEVRNELNVPELPILLHRREVRQRVPIPGDGRILRMTGTYRRIILAVGLCTRGEIVAPAHTVLMEQVGEIGPVVVCGRARYWRKSVVVRAARRISGPRARGRPAGDHEEV